MTTVLAKQVTGGGGSSAESDTLAGGDWNASGGQYYADFTHGLGTRPVLIQCFRTSDYMQIEPADIDLTDTNTARIWMPTNTVSLEVVATG